MKFKEWINAESKSPSGWDFLNDDMEPLVSHEALPSFPGGPPPVEKGMVRLYRGTLKGYLPHRNAYFSDERGLEGVARAFAKVPGRHLVYVDVPKEVADRCLLGGCVTDGEYTDIPLKYRQKIRALQ